MLKQETYLKILTTQMERKLGGKSVEALESFFAANRILPVETAISCL